MIFPTESAMMETESVTDASDNGEKRTERTGQNGELYNGDLRAFDENSETNYVGTMVFTRTYLATE